MYYHNPLSENRRAVFKKLIRKHLLRPARGTVPRKAILEDRVELPLPIEGGPIVLRRLRGDEDTYFVGSPTGMHRVSNMRTPHEITVHWEGYVDNAARSVEGFLRHYEAILALLEEADPTPTGSYATWIFKMFRGKHTSYEDARTLHEMLSEFDAKKHRLPPELRDINSYAKPGDVSRAMREHFEESKRGRYQRLVQEGSELIYEREGLFVYRITTPEAANRVAQKTQWCVKDERIAKNYLSEAPLYYIDVTPEYENQDESDIQYPVLAHAGSEIQIRDVDDATISTTDSEDLDDIKQALLAADQKFVCPTHNELKLRECETCYSAGICPNCGKFVPNVITRSVITVLKIAMFALNRCARIADAPVISANKRWILAVSKFAVIAATRTSVMIVPRNAVAAVIIFVISVRKLVLIAPSRFASAA